MNNLRSFISRTIITALIYSALLLPFQLNVPLLEGTDLRPSAFVPIVFGIFWGLPAALGVFIGNLFCDMVSFSTIYVLAGSFLNALSALCARRVFYASWNHPLSKGMFIYSFGSLLNFFFTVITVELALSSSISALLHLYSDISFESGFAVVFFNNVHSNILLGVPAMLYLPLIGKWADIPEGNGGRGRFFATLAVLLISPLITYLCTLLPDSYGLCLIVVCLLPMLFVVSVVKTISPVSKDTTLYGFKSIKYTTFRRIMVFAILSSVLFCIVIVRFLVDYESDRASIIVRTLHVCSAADVIYLLFFSLLYKNVEKNLIDPIHSVASKISNDSQNCENELEVISDRLDFIVSGDAEHIPGNEFSITIGLTTKDNSKRFSIAEANSIIDNICLKHVSGYISSVEGTGGYKGAEYEGMEQMLIYTIYGATDSQIERIAHDVLIQLDQESVIIEKNKILRYYYYGGNKYSL